MECPNCLSKLKLDNVPFAKLMNIWGGVINCPDCSSLIRRSLSSLIFLNFALIGLLAAYCLAQFYLTGPYFVAACGAIFIAALLAGKAQKWVPANNENHG